MGPSTNLSARLMGKAGPEQIICDEDARQRDRSHRFIKLSEVRAKGYAHLVPTFQPVLASCVSLSAVTGRSGSGDAAEVAQQQPLLLRQDSTATDPEEQELKTVFADLAAAEQQLVATSTSSENHNRDAADMEHQLAAASYDAYYATDAHGAGVRVHATAKGSQQRDAAPRAAVPFYGRGEEVFKVFRFLVPLVVDQMGSRSLFCELFKQKDASEVAAYPTGVRIQLDTSKAAALAVLEGPSGIGKTAMMQIFRTRTQQHVFRIDSKANLEIFMNRSSSFNHTEPFSCWRTVIRALLLQLATRDKHQQLKRVTYDGKVTALHLGLDAVLQYLPNDLHALAPLLSSVHIVRGLASNETTRRLSGADKLHKLIELLAAIIQGFTTYTQKLAIILL